MSSSTLHFLPITSRSSFRQHEEHSNLNTNPRPDTIRDLTSLATTLIKAPAKPSTTTTPGIPPYACAISKRQIQWQASPLILSSKRKPHSSFHQTVSIHLTFPKIQARSHRLHLHPRQKTDKIPRCSVMVGGRDPNVRTEKSDGEGEVGKGGSGRGKVFRGGEVVGNWWLGVSYMIM